MNPVRAAVSRPYTVAVAVILVVLFSLLAMERIPVQLKPQVDTPRIEVKTAYRGASAQEVEEEITRELEDALQAVEGTTEMTSNSGQGSSTVTLEFPLGTDTNRAVVDVINKLSRVPRLPPEADEPQVSIASAGDQEVVLWLAIQSHYDENFVRQIAEQEIKARLERVTGVSGLFMAGGSEREIQVRVDTGRMVAHGVTFEQLSAAVIAGNRNLRGGTVETSGRRLVVRTVGRALEAVALQDLIVLETEIGAVRLGDVAEIVDTYREREGFVNLNGAPGVAIGVQREVGANVVQLIADVLDELDALNGSFASRGFDIYLKPLYREDLYIDQAIALVRDNLAIGAALAVAVLLLFLRSPRSVLVVAISIPISLVSVFLVMSPMGRTLNVISLAGIAFASGMVVDNAIVVLENIFRHLELGKSPMEAAVDGGREVWGGVLASTLTTVAVFVPILLQQDEAAQLFKDIALAISVGVGASLVVALTVVPVLASLLFRHAPKAAVRPGLVARAYGRFCERLAHPRPGWVSARIGFVLLVVAGAVASLRLAPPAGYLPTGNRNLVLFLAGPIAGTRPEAVRKNFASFEQAVLANPKVERMFTVAGRSFNGGGVTLKDEYATPEELDAFHRSLRPVTSTLPGFRFLVPIRSSIFEFSGKQFEVDLSGPDFERLAVKSKLVEERLRAVEGVSGVRSSLVVGQPELQVVIDEERAKDLDLDVVEIGRVVELAVAGRRLTTLIDDGREVDVNVVAPQSHIGSDTDLEALTFLAGDGRSVTLGSVAQVRWSTGPTAIQRLERERNVTLTVDMDPGAPLESVVNEVEERVFPILAAELGPAYTLRVAGSADKLKTTLDSLTSGIGLSVLIIYLLLVALFRSWFTPIVILVTVPLALSGGLIGIRVANHLSGGLAAYDVIAMLGFVILAGLVVNNAILIVHQAGNFREEGHSYREALSLSARSRLRPILMSVVTTVFGMLPLAWGGGAGAELYQGLGAVIVGGLVVSTLFTLFLVPVLLSLKPGEGGAEAGS